MVHRPTFAAVGYKKRIQVRLDTSHSATAHSFQTASYAVVSLPSSLQNVTNELVVSLSHLISPHLTSLPVRPSVSTFYVTNVQ